MPKYSLIESFHIDNGELDGLSPQHCFALGVEWQKYHQFAMNHDAGLELPPGPHLLHSVNLARVEALLQKHEVPYRIRQSHDDWVEVIFGEITPEEPEGGDNGSAAA